MEEPPRAAKRRVSGLAITRTAAGVRFSVRVAPRASADAIGGVHGDALRVRVSAPPVDDAANRGVVELLARALRVPKRAVRIVGGHASKSKLVEVDGVEPAAIEALARAARPLVPRY
ncbi:MAG: DUF167 domain-containing protein [Sandaracinaceae bacterium]